jgi:hypothetical protein
MAGVSFYTSMTDSRAAFTTSAIRSSPHALGGALEHVLGGVYLEHPDRIALGRVDVELERHARCVEKRDDAAAILIDRIRAVSARGGLEDSPGVAERIRNGR